MRGDTEITNRMDIISLRDVAERIRYLEDDEDEDAVEERAKLQAFLEEAEGYSADGLDGYAIRESYTEEYAQQTAEDLGLIDNSGRWPSYCIDWEQATREFLMDYSGVEFDGVTYYIR